MKNDKQKPSLNLGLLGKSNIGMRPKLTGILLIVKIIPIFLLAILAFFQISALAEQLRDIAVADSTAALNARAVESIERLTTDAAQDVADFLYERDDDILYLAKLAKLYNGDFTQMEKSFEAFSTSKTKWVVRKGDWVLSEDGKSWVRTDTPTLPDGTGGGQSTNEENDYDPLSGENDGFNYRDPDALDYEKLYLYDEITFIEYLENDDKLEEKAKYVAKNGYETGENVYTPNGKKYEKNSTIRAAKAKENLLSNEKRDVNVKISEGIGAGNYENTFVKAEVYPGEVGKLREGEIYVSDVIGEYVGTNLIGMYTEEKFNPVAGSREDPVYNPEKQAYAGKENPKGKRFAGIVRWATPVYDGDVKVGYVTFALNHDHIMEYVDHITPMDERYTELPSAFEGNYAFIWDYQSRSICHPRHHSIVGFDAETGNRQIPWLETSIYDEWQAKKEEKPGEYDYWYDYISQAVAPFSGQSRDKSPAAPLTYSGRVGLDGRYLNNAPQCTGWMDLTKDGGSGSFYIKWSGIWKLNTAGAIPYYTGQYAPSAANEFSRRGFGFVAIGAGLDDFTAAAEATGTKLSDTIDDGLSGTITTLVLTVAGILAAIILIAVWIATAITRSITDVNSGMIRFRSGERQFRFKTERRDEFGSMADSFDDMADSIEDSVKNPLSIADMDRKIIYVNDKSLKLLNNTFDNIIGRNYGDCSIYPPNSEYCPITALNEKRESAVYFDARSGRYFHGVASYLLDEKGNKKGYLIESYDVTEMTLQQQQTEQQRQLLDRMFSASPDLIWYEDNNGVFLSVNPRFASIIGLKPEDFVGKQTKELLQGDQFESFIANDNNALISKKPLYSEEVVKFADGHEETLESVRTPIFGENDKVTGLLGFARNITVRVRIESALRQTQLDLEKAVETANSASQHKGDFLARMSHEIRTPMNAVIGITDIVLKKLSEMEDGKDTKELKGYLNQIDSSSKHLLGLLNDILDISKIEAGKIELTGEIISVNKLLSTVAGMIKPRCDEKNITLITDFAVIEPDSYKCDSLRLRQVLINLLGNAVKFTNECGVVSFNVGILEDLTDKTLFRFAVKDTGIGIAKDAQESVFEAFEQAGRSITRKYGGTGLGLAISKRIVELFGGSIKLESEPGEGSVFSFDIYLEKSNAAADDEIEVKDVAGKFKGKRILIVDDVDINRMIVRAMLEETEAETEEANDGQAAIDVFAASPPYRFDIILMDIKMPNVDGYEAAAAIRALDRDDAKTVPIIALTANAFKDDIDKAINYGMNAHISKPVESAVLYSLLMKYLGKG